MDNSLNSYAPVKFSIRDLLFVTVIVALAVGWWMDRNRLAKEIRKLKDRSPYFTLDVF